MDLKRRLRRALTITAKEFKDALDAAFWNEASDSIAYFTVDSLVDFSSDKSAQRFYRVVVVE